MDNPKFYKTEKGDVINMMMITQMYKKADFDYCIVEFAGGSTKCVITEEEMKRLYENFMFNIINI